MGLFSKKKKDDPAFKAAQQASQAIMERMANTQLPALPVIPQAATPNVTVPASLPSYLGGGAGTVYPAGLPNQLSMIANQLSAGGYGAPGDISAQLSGIYKPQVVAPYVPPPPPPVVKPLGFTAQQPTPISEAFPWLAYSKAHPYTHLGPHYTLQAEGARSWQDYLKSGSTWKAPGSKATTYTNPFG